MVAGLPLRIAEHNMNALSPLQNLQYTSGPLISLRHILLEKLADLLGILCWHSAPPPLLIDVSVAIA
jgi:hypothetical protein